MPSLATLILSARFVPLCRALHNVTQRKLKYEGVRPSPEVACDHLLEASGKYLSLDWKPRFTVAFGW